MNNKIIQLNNDFVNDQLKQTNDLIKKSPKRKHLAFILVLVILLMSLPTIQLIKSYELLKTRRAVYAEVIKKNDDMAKQVADKKAEINKLQDPDYLEKYARGKYHYSKDGETIFRTETPLDIFSK